MNARHHKKSNMKNTNGITKKQLSYILPAFLFFMVSVYIGFNLTGKTASAEDIMVYKSPTCGCCEKWVTHLRKEGFNVTTKDMQNVKPVKKQIGVAAQYQSCHTAKVGKYFIEGHVSASDIKKLLKEKPDIKGLTVPGMPMGSPGMEGHRKDNYDVLAIDKNNNATVYSKH